MKLPAKLYNFPESLSSGAKIYLAGPMTGMPSLNFEAFMYCESNLKEVGWKVFNPAQFDIEAGFDPREMSYKEIEEFLKERPHFLDEAMQKDLEAIMCSDAVAMLPDWEQSTGALAEYHLARWRHIPVYDAKFGHLIPERHRLAPFPQTAKSADNTQSILTEAKNLIFGDRNDDYGPAKQDFECIAKLWSALVSDQKANVVFTAEDVARFMICVKLSRDSYSSKRDNAVDIAGYAALLDQVRL